MARTPPASLWEALGRFQLSEILRWDFLAGLAGGLGGALLGLYSRETLDGVIPIAAGVVGVIIGAVVGGAAILGSFLDQSFLRKLKLIGREPVHYLAPFLFTAAIGVIGSIATAVLVSLPPSTSDLIVTIAAFVAGLFTLWTIASVLYDLDMLVQFIGLQVDAADVVEDGNVSDVRRRNA